MTAFDALILAPPAPPASSRGLTTLLWPLLGRPLLGHVLHAAREAGVERLTVAAGARDGGNPTLAALAAAHGAELLTLDVPPAAPGGDDDDSAAIDPRFLAAALEACSGHTLLVLDGGAALLTPATLRQLVSVHAQERATASRLLTGAPRPGPRPPCVCLLERATTLSAWHALLATGRGDCDLGDLFVALVGRGRVVATTAADEPAELAMAASPAGLAAAAAVLRERRNHELLLSGVVIEDPATTWVDVTASVAPGARLRPSCLLEGRTRVEAGAEIGPFTRLVDTQVGAGAVVLDHCLLRGCAVEEGASVGPFAHVRPESRIRRGAKVGNFVELKKTDLGERSKAQHLSYLGDATVGAGVNVGAGTITCNYDGADKHATRIDDGAFIGSDTTLVAPVTVGAGAYVGAGSTITRDVAPDALALTRAPQTVREGWAARRRAARKPPSS